MFGSVVGHVDRKTHYSLQRRTILAVFGVHLDAKIPKLTKQFVLYLKAGSVDYIGFDLQVRLG